MCLANLLQLLRCLHDVFEDGDVRPQDHSEAWKVIGDAFARQFQTQTRQRRRNQPKNQDDLEVALSDLMNVINQWLRKDEHGLETIRHIVEGLAPLFAFKRIPVGSLIVQPENPHPFEGIVAFVDGVLETAERPHELLLASEWRVDLRDHLLPAFRASI